MILDIGTHVLAMLRETIRYCGGTDEMHLEVRQVSDRTGHAIARGDTQTAEGKAHLQGQLSGIPLNIWLNKYAGPAGGQKGCASGYAMGALSIRTGAIIAKWWS